MELAREKKSTAVEKVLQDGTVQALAVKKFDEVANKLPKKIEGTFEVPKIREMILATSEKNVQGFIEFELIKLAERINVSGNLTDSQVQFIASQLIDQFPNETIADFKICFERGASGRYGRIYKIDGVEIGIWMRGIKDEHGNIKQIGYLDEKYEVMENQLMAEKDNQYKISPNDTNWLKMWADAVAETDSKGGVKTTSRNMALGSRLKAMTDKEIREEGQKNPKNKQFKGYLTEAEQIARQMLSRSAADFYKKKRHGFDLKPFSAPFTANGESFEVEFMAESEDDAIAIYNMIDSNSLPRGDEKV